LVANLMRSDRPRAASKFIHIGDEKFFIRGLTYGTFRPNPGGEELPEAWMAQKDLKLMRELGANAIRVYTLPSSRFLDEAEQNNLKVMVGIPWAQHVCFGDQSHIQREILQNVRGTMRRLRGHRAVLAVAIGNEIPAPIVRWHGRKKIERFLRDLYEEAKQIDPQMLVTYVNYPPTEYLELSFLDLCCFNLFLHCEQDFRAYLARLQNIAGNKPLVLTEIGIDSMREGRDRQAEILSWQLRAAYGLGVSGVFIFSWTDDWYRGGFQVEDWAFGLVDSRRNPKPAFAAVKAAFAEAPFPTQNCDEGARLAAPSHPESKLRNPGLSDWPKVSVVICAYNAESTMEDCLQSLMRLNYPDYEVIVINDGSSDRTAAIAEKFPVKLISVPNGGLSAARNLGLQAATGEIVAYTDSDCRVDPDWLSYLIQPFLNSDVVAVGGPNVVPFDDPWMAHMVARSPGGPTHVLLTDSIAEHIPGCNMAFHKWALEEVNGFDPIFTKAGDDVDICWRLQERGYRIGFSHSALVWHHHRSSVRAYWRQQVGYGEGEALLEKKHPNKFNSLGHVLWHGRIYSPLPAYRALTTQRIYQGRWGSSAFPSVYHRPNGYITHLPSSIEWQLLMALLALGSAFNPWLLPVPLIGFLLTLWRCLANAAATDLRDAAPIEGAPGWLSPLLQRAAIAFLHFIQPLARIKGRLSRFRIFDSRSSIPCPAPEVEIQNPKSKIQNQIRSSIPELLRAILEGDITYWSANGVEKESFLTELVNRLSRRPVPVSAISLDDGWQEQYDLAIGRGPFVEAQIKAVSENHGGSNRLIRVASRLRIKKISWAALMTLIVFLAYFTRSIYSPWPVTALIGLGVANLIILWRGAKLLAQLARAEDEAAEGIGILKFKERQPGNEPVVESSSLEQETAR